MRLTLVLLVGFLGITGCGRRPPEPAPRVELRGERPHTTLAARRRAAPPEADPVDGAGFDDLRDLGTAREEAPPDPPTWDEDEPLDDEVPPLEPLPG